MSSHNWIRVFPSSLLSKHMQELQQCPVSASPMDRRFLLWHIFLTNSNRYSFVSCSDVGGGGAPSNQSVWVEIWGPLKVTAYDSHHTHPTTQWPLYGRRQCHPRDHQDGNASSYVTGDCSQQACLCSDTSLRGSDCPTSRERKDPLVVGVKRSGLLFSWFATHALAHLSKNMVTDDSSGRSAFFFLLLCADQSLKLSHRWTLTCTFVLLMSSLCTATFLQQAST